MRRGWIAVIVTAAVAVALPAAAAPSVEISYLEYVPSASTFRVKRLPVSGSSVQVSTRSAVTAPSYSPDGNRIAFSGGVGDATLGLYAIFTAGLNGSGLTQVTPGSFAEMDPTWSPDGSTIVFSQNTAASYNRSSCCRLARVPASGGSITAITSSVGAVRPDYSPTGNLIAYDNPNGVWTVSPSGGTATLVASGGWDASFSPDGSAIAFVARSGSNTLIRTVPVSGGSPTTIYTTSRQIEDLAWRGNGVWFLEFDGLGYEGRANVEARRIGATGGSPVTEVIFSTRVAGLTVPRGDPAVHLVGRFDSGQTSDIAVLQAGRRLVLLSGGSSFSTADWGALTPEVGWARHLAGDFDGNGLTDVAGYRPDGTWRVAASSGSSFSTSIWATYSTKTGWSPQLAGDFNGDGRDDIANYYSGNGTWWVSRSTGSSFSTSLWATYSTKTGWTSRLVGDFNGDGRDDIANYFPGNGTWWISRSTGTGFATGLWATYSTKTGWNPQLVGDFNGDGRDDIANYHPSNGTWWVSRSTGTGFATSLWAAP